MTLKARDTDKFLILITLLLVSVGVVMVYSTSSIMAMRRFWTEYFFVKKHLTYALAGVALFIVAMKVPYKVYYKLAYPALIIAVILLVCIYIPGLGVKAGGARRWVKLGGLAFQPSEPAKLAVVFFLAYSLSSKAGRIKEFAAGFLPNIVIPGVVIGLIVLEPDLGTAVTVGSLVLVMMFAGGVRITHMLALAAPAVAAAWFIIHRFSYMMTRITVFLDPWKDPEGKGFQIVQSFIAFGSGGLSGVGLGEGRQKLFFLPEAHTDFILSVIGEELGFMGVGAIIALYAMFLACGVTIAMRAKDLHGQYLALGLTFMVVLQAAINMAVVMGLLPPKGLTLPFISYGGTSLVVNMIAVGILLNIYIVENGA